MNIFLDSGGKILFVSSTLKYHCYLKFKKMSLTVEMGGGLPILMDDPSSGDLEMLVEPGSVVMQSDPSDASQGFSQQNVDWITQVIKYIKKYSHAITKKCNFKSLESVCPRVIIMFCLCPCRHKKHLIQDAELGFAVLHCSTEQHCNPDVPFSEYYVHWSRLFNALFMPVLRLCCHVFHFTNAVSQIPQPQIPSQSLTQTDILAHNTEPGARYHHQNSAATSKLYMNMLCYDKYCMYLFFVYF